MSRTHAIIEKKVINHDSGTGRHIMCCWDECTNDGVDLHKVVHNMGTANEPKLMKYVFCTERHKMYFVHSTRDLGNLPPGYKRSII